MNKILVTGGAGYIGGFMLKALLDKGFEVTSIDSLDRGHREAVDVRANLIIGSLLDKNLIESVFLKEKFDAVIHFGAFISMGESMENPGIYFENNILGALNILEGMRKNGVKNFIFSSTAGVYGNPIKIPISEDHPKNPTNPYGESKLEVERILNWYKIIFGINSVCLRYFNAAGAMIDGSLGENHSPETHIIPNAIRAALTNSEFLMFGSDYNTPDGTCIRDYIHVLDLVESHILALEKINKENGQFIYNVGTGRGHSNKEVIDMVKKISGIELNVKIQKRRPGDADILVADTQLIRQELNFNPRYSDLETIVKSAWEWHKNENK